MLKKILKKATEFKYLTIVLLLSMIVRVFLLHPIYSDETIYFNAGKLILDGKIPYKDYFLAHPPIQIFVYTILFKIFGMNFSLVKIFQLLFSSSCVLVLFLIVKEIYDKKTALTSSIIFLFTPSFIIFSLIGIGMWESMLFILISFYLILKNKPLPASIFYNLAIFTRYISLIYLPFFISYIYFKRKKLLNFLKPLSIFLLISFSIFSFVFGFEYINQTILYHLQRPKGTTDMTQYFSIGFFTLFLSAIAIFIGYVERDMDLIFFATTPLFADLMILFLMNPVYYHYFLISIPFLCIGLGRIFMKSRYKAAKIVVVAILFLSILSNFQTIDFYLNPKHSFKFYYISELVQKNVSKNETIFGEPAMVNFISLTKGVKIFNDYTDSYLQHISFEGETEFIQKLEKNPPKIFIDFRFDNKSYYLSNPKFVQFMSGYILVERIEGIPAYDIYLHK